jgi:RNA-binding protein YhbY
MENITRKELKKISSQIKPKFNIGKSGISSNLLDQLDKYLEANNIVKVKSLICENSNELEIQAKEIGEKLDAEVIEIRGFNFVLYREN